VNQFLGLSRFSCFPIAERTSAVPGGWCLYQDMIQKVVDLLVPLDLAD